MESLTPPVCPHCGSHHVRAASAIYASGTQTIDLRNKGVGVGVGHSRGGWGVGAGVTRGRSRGTATSLEAKRCAPPRYMTAARFLVTCGLGWGAMFGFQALIYPAPVAFIFAGTWAIFMGLAMFLAGALMGKPVVSASRAREFDADYARTWMCTACGGIFLR